MIAPPRAICRALDLEITPLSDNDLLHFVNQAISQGEGATVAGHNLHSAFLVHSDPDFRDFYTNADVILADGAPVLWDYFLSGNKTSCKRIGSTDWIPQLHKVSGLQRVLVIGAISASNAAFCQRMQQQLPLASVIGLPADPWTDSIGDTVQNLICNFMPQLVLIGLGMPKQEQVAREISQKAPSIVIATVGGAIDQLSGYQKNAPRWLGRFGLEWLWRLTRQPRRLSRRYLVEPWQLLAIRVAQVMKQKHL